MVDKLATLGVIAVLCAVGSAWAESDRLADGRRAYEDSCASCHDTGVDGAPSIENPDDWGTRSSLWEAVLSEHANKGYLAMPAKGGAGQLSEYDVDAAVEYMLTRLHPELPAD